MEEGLLTLLLRHPPLAAQVGNGINWDAYPQGAGPAAIALYYISGAPGYTSTGEDGLTRSRVQVDVRVRKADENDYAAQTRAVDIGNIVRRVLSGYRGTVGTTRFGGIFMRSRRAQSDHTGAEYFHRVSMDFEVWSSPAG